MNKTKKPSVDSGVTVPGIVKYVAQTFTFAFAQFD